jgi:hypothetical protein
LNGTVGPAASLFNAKAQRIAKAQRDHYPSAVFFAVFADLCAFALK